MKARITFLKRDFANLRSHLLKGAYADEEAAFLVCGTSSTPEHLNFLVRKIVLVPDEALLSKGPAGLEISPEFISIVMDKPICV